MRDAENQAENLRVFNAEQLALNLLCDKPIFRIAAEEGITPENFTDSLHKRLAQKIYELYALDGLIDINKLLSQFDDSERGRVSKILLDDKNTHDKKRAALQAFGIIKQEQNLLKQENLLEEGDLKALDILIRQRKKKN